ncbi:DDB1- and CUL4-associated factor 5-like [Dendronephthya gigantea]|uniref:DDB1- and CUL4-associated factor 5-like n=1 Tax=Dendronephthya gigantea TaxID=151771 RepID=UPI00106B169C|nr:DDB1- and CUL4-associated factor 5-like [Dendronephthya gigantea]
MHKPYLCSGALYFQYQTVIETYGAAFGNVSKKYLSEKFSSSKWLYSKNLVGHTECVNALAFSERGGEFLVSGGDDRRVLVWNLREAVTGNTTPRCMKQQHQSNIFCVTFDHDNRQIISAGNDEIILCHDSESGELVRSFDAEANTNEICFHPEDNNIFIAAEATFGELTLFDIRAPTERTTLAVPWPVKATFSYFPNVPNFSSAKFNPVDPSLIVTANLINGVQLWDTRYPRRCLRHFESSFPKRGSQIAMSVAFDWTGRYIAAVRKSDPPVLYHIDREYCLAEFCEKGYGNKVTRKSVCFAGLKDEFIMTGSEDFNVYLWKVPKLSKDHVGVAKVEQSSLALEGHRSIVNQVCFNHDTAMICSSGVEKIIKMWSPFQMSGGIPGDKVCEKRRLYTNEEYERMLNEDWPRDYESTGEDEKMLAMVDQWLLSKEFHSPSDDSESDESPAGRVGGFADEGENEYLNELSSPESTDSEYSESPGANNLSIEKLKHLADRISQNPQGKVDKISANARNSDTISQDTEPPENISQNATSLAGLSAKSSDQNSQKSTGENFESTVKGIDKNSEIGKSTIINSQNSDGVGLERLREIIPPHDRPRNSLARIAELRRKCLKDEDD